MPRVLVTGAAGMIGGAVAKRLRMLGLDVIAVDVTDAGAGNLDIKLAPLEDLDRLRASVGSEPVNAIVHCGAISGPMLAKGDPPTIIRANVIGLTNVLALGLEHRIARFVFCSSIGVYGNAPGGPGPEYHTLKPTSLYGASKVAGEALLTGYAAEYRSQRRQPADRPRLWAGPKRKLPDQGGGRALSPRRTGRDLR